MDERDWSILLTLYEEKNITRAAKKLFISQSSLTSHIHDIEARFGVKVVVRSKQGVTFTEEGEYLVQCAREMIVLNRLSKVLALMLKEQFNWQLLDCLQNMSCL